MIRALEPGELGAASHLAAAAFREDPGFAHVLPDDARRRWRLPSLIETILRADAALGGRVRGAFDGDALVGVASILPGGAANPGFLSWAKASRGLGWLLADPAAVLRALALGAAVERLRPAGDDYLHLLAVHPATQGRGVGGALLRDALKSGKPLYLETFTPGNAAWYEARGFVRRLESAAANRPTFWTLRRA